MTFVAGPTFQRGQATHPVNQQASGKDANGTKQMPRSLAPTTLPRDTAKVTKGLKGASKPGVKVVSSAFGPFPFTQAAS